MATYKCVLVGWLLCCLMDELIGWSAGVQHVVMWGVGNGEEQSRIARRHTVTSAQVWSSFTTRKVSLQQHRAVKAL